MVKIQTAANRTSQQSKANRGQTTGKPQQAQDARKKQAQSFPIFVTGYPMGLSTADVECRLEDLYSKYYGPCWVHANAKGFSHVFFRTFEASLAALSDPYWVKFEHAILEADASFETIWACHVLDHVKKNGSLSFQNAERMAEAGVGSRRYKPANFLTPLRRVRQLYIDNTFQEIRWIDRDDSTTASKARQATAVDATAVLSLSQPTASPVQLPSSSASLDPHEQSALSAQITPRASSGLPGRYARAEVEVWGAEQSGSLRERVERLEEEVFGRRDEEAGGLVGRLALIEAQIGL